MDILPQQEGCLLVARFSGNLIGAQPGECHPFHIVVQLIGPGAAVAPKKAVVQLLQPLGIPPVSRALQSVDQRVDCMRHPPVMKNIVARPVFAWRLDIIHLDLFVPEPFI
ncbi:hypothetical protein D3C74_366170 [compost metagenome]